MNRLVRSMSRSWMQTFLLGVIAFLTIYPLVWLLFGSFWSSSPGEAGELTLQGYISAYTAPKFLQTLLNTLLIAFIVIILSMSLSIFMAWAITRTNTPGRHWLEKLVLMAFFIPPTLTVLSWILLASKETGLINQFTYWAFGVKPFNIFSLWGIIWHITLTVTSLSFMLIVGPFRTMDSTLEEAGRVAGGRPAGVFFRVTLPLLSPAIIGAAILVFIRVLEAFEAPAFIGIPAKITVFITLIYDAIAFRQPPQYGVAMATAMTLLVITVVCVILQWWYMRGKSFTTVTGKNFKPAITDLKKWKWATFSIVILYFFVAVLLPTLQLVITSFLRVAGIYTLQMLTLDNYRMIFQDPIFWRSMRNTLFLSIVGAFICMFLSAFISYVVVKTNYRGKKMLDLISWVPWMIPGLVLALGMLWGYINLPAAINLYGTIWILLVAYIVIGLPLGVRNMSAAFIQLSNDLEESARVHGASWWISFRTIMIALIQPSFVAGWFLLFILFSRELSASVLLYSYGNEVLPVTIFSYWSSGRTGAVAAISVIYMLVTLVILIAQILITRLLARRRERRLLQESEFGAGKSNDFAKSI